MPKYSGWLIVSECRDVLVHRGGRDMFVPATRRGIPSGALVFQTPHEARNEAGVLMSLGVWPLQGRLIGVYKTWT